MHCQEQHDHTYYSVLINLDSCTFQGRRLLVEEKECAEIIDPKLGNKYDVKEVESMMHAASLCISPHPEQRPRMSKVSHSLTLICSV